jgi:hypothetical protein
LGHWALLIAPRQAGPERMVVDCELRSRGPISFRPGTRMQMKSEMPEWAFVQLLRDYFVVNRSLRSVFDRFRRGESCFEDVAALVGDSESNILFRLKGRCHALFRSDPTLTLEVRREVLFDLTVGSLFHEAMKLRENLYQQEVYVSRVEFLLDQNEVDVDEGEFLREFEKIQLAGADRTHDAAREFVRLGERLCRPALAPRAGGFIDDRGVGRVLSDAEVSEARVLISGNRRVEFCRQQAIER